MSSSTFSSEAARGGRARAAGIALMLLAALALLEGITREILWPASRDLSRFQTYAARARDLVGAPAPRVALIGSSTTERGVQLDALRSEWQARTDRPLSVDMFVADASGVNTWYWMVAHDFWKPNLNPDLFVLTYHGDWLTDSSAIEVGRIAQFFTGADDRAMIFEHDFTTLEQRLDYLLSSISQMWAARDRIRERTLKLAPGYEAFATETNAVNFEHERRRQRVLGAPAATYHAFHRFVDRARREGVQVCFVAFPSLPKRPGTMPYPLAPEVLEAIAAAGMLHLDLRRVEELSPAMYQDEIHLNAEGQRVYTRKLAEELARVWSPR